MNKEPNRASLTQNIASAEIRLPSDDLNLDLPFFTKTLGFRLDTIFPADNPTVAVVSCYGICIRLEMGATEPAGTLRLLCTNPAQMFDGKTSLTAPNGTKIEIIDANPPLITPQTQHSFVVRRLKDNDPWVIGRAGMHYRDLVPDRLGGSIIASHIRIPDGGPVPDMVHYHTVGFQLIFCYRGWVDVVYEDQGPPIRLSAGDCFLQPPQIRHRVLVASDNVEVIEIGVPAEHITTIDHELELPTPNLRPERDFGGQIFCNDKVSEAQWKPWRMNGFKVRETAINSATKAVAGVNVAQFDASTGSPPITTHNTDILFTFVMEGTLTLHGEDGVTHALEPGDAFVVPPDTKTQYCDCSSDLELLEVTLPGNFETAIHADW